MRIPHVSQCCCGCKLETGALFIGWITLIFSIIGLIFVALALFVLEIAFDEMKKQREANGIEVKSVSVSDFIDTSTFLTLGSLFTLSVILLVGVNQKNDKYLHTWVIINCYIIFLYIASYTGNSIIVMIRSDFFLGLYTLIIGFLTSLLELYFICVVYNLRRQFTNEKLNKATFPLAQNLL